MPRTSKRTKSEPEETDAPDIQPDTPDIQTDIKFPPDGLFTGVAIAEELGVHADTIRKRYYPEAIEIWGDHADCLRQGQLYTSIAYEEFFRMRQLRNANRLILNSADRIVRQADGKPAVEANPEKMTKRVYKALRWKEQPELVPGHQPDSVEEANEANLNESAIVPKAYDVELVDDFNSTLDRVDDIGVGLGGFMEALEASAQQSADAASAAWANKFTDRFSENMQNFQKQMGKSMSHKR
ncbi:hypothetical protein IQ235_00920 [Oscillatoriales cyanobacterium LEGE 11467]|uniref:Uncharacterized protein n=1 Tax=Zarconia navalis LEGE 11467 TaxID=1828826 RepID=A0A928VSA8_9CYAN|nr:hypothetical protein [Zarconia navalis]MBE9039357.1 hypothetical protein [Zarconia navalis LEGE 11467]